MISVQKSAMSLAILMLCAMAPTAMGLGAQRVGKYDFTYFTSGDSRATPVQVFDDSKSTYFQFRSGDAIPAIFLEQDGKSSLMVPEFEGPYVRINDVAGQFTLQLGRSQSRVVYGGVPRLNSPQISVQSPNGMSTPYTGAYPSNPNVKLVASLAPTLATINSDALESNSYATPTKGDKVTWKSSETEQTENQVWFPRSSSAVGPLALKAITALVDQARGASNITIVGRDDDSLKEGLDRARALAIQSILIKAGIAQDKITIKTGVQSPSKDKLWASDIRIERVLPTQVARPSSGLAPASTTERSAYVKSNLENLVRSGVLTVDQAQAILRRSGDAPAPAPAPVVAQAPAPTQPPGHPDMPPGGFEIKASDKLVSATIKRWASATGYELIWDAPTSSDAPITGDLRIPSANMKDALERVVGSLQVKGYDIQAAIYTSRHIRISRITK